MLYRITIATLALFLIFSFSSAKENCEKGINEAIQGVSADEFEKKKETLAKAKARMVKMLYSEDFKRWLIPERAGDLVAEIVNGKAILKDDNSVAIYTAAALAEDIEKNGWTIITQNKNYAYSSLFGEFGRLYYVTIISEAKKGIAWPIMDYPGLQFYQKRKGQEGGWQVAVWYFDPTGESLVDKDGKPICWTPEYAQPPKQAAKK